MIGGYWYVDTRLRDVFIIPNISIGINSKKGLEIILDTKKLKWWGRFFKRKKRYIGQNLVYRFQIPDENLSHITELCFSNEIDKAKEYLTGFFKGLMVNEKKGRIGADSDFGDYDSGIDMDGYDPRFKPDF